MDAGVLERIEFHALDVTTSGRFGPWQIRSASETNPARPHHDAGFAVPGFAGDVTDAELREQFDTNFFGSVAVTRRFCRRCGSRLSATSSWCRQSPDASVSRCQQLCRFEICAGRLDRNAALRMLPLGIHAVLVEPGSFATDIWTRNAKLTAGLENRLRPMRRACSMAQARSKRSAKDRANPSGRRRDCPHSRETAPKLRYTIGKDAKMALRMRRICLPAYSNA